MSTTGRSARVRAPELAGGEWLNTTRALSLRDLRGRFVLVDFWSSCCGNCLHVIDELRGLEASHADVLTVVGVHSPKFPHERELRVVADAVARNEIAHPVRNDPDMRLWQQYAVRAWPTLVLIDPEGYVVAQAAGEGQVSGLTAVLDELVTEHERRGTLRRGTFADVAPTDTAAADDLRFPAKAIALPAARTGRVADSLLVADAGHHQLVELAADGHTVLRRLGTSGRGAPFTEPNGLTLLPAGLVDYDVLVADTAAHALFGVRLADGAVVKRIDLAAALAALETVTGAVPPVPSPWDVAWWPALGRVVVAAAGVHLLLSVDPTDEAVAILAGTTVEGLRDGDALDAWLAQPSGLAVDGQRVWFVDAESSAVRFLDTAGQVHTAVGEGLFDFGHVDGPAAQARLQHPLGVTLLDDGSLAVADTYNGAVRRLAGGTLTTLASGLAEPSGVALVDGTAYVVESAAHRLTPLDVYADAAVVDGAAERSVRPVTEIAAGAVALRIVFEPAPGRTLDDRYGPATALSVSASPPQLLRSGGGDGAELTRELDLAPGAGTLHVTARAASCDDSACYLARQDWGVPVRVGDGGTATLDLVLSE
ncbi:thioredoxin-like domain-containing protein [uncultured Jatrophihabitans sp.]|uniref:thioredoxin-like domain-containing protein n=1 Tax=uncultured Jatrophihabitans sp. TaxID=1610747 RepID=UPI0035CB7B9C